MAQTQELGVPLVSTGRTSQQPLEELEAGLEASDISTSGASDLGSGASAGAGGLRPLQGSLLSRVFLTWVFPVLRRASAVEQLELSDLFAVPDDGKPEHLYKTFMASWQRQRERDSRRRRPRRTEGMALLLALARVHLPGMRLLWLGRFTEVLLEFTFPLFLNLLVKFVDDPNAPLWKGLLYAVALLTAQVVGILIDNNVSVGMRSVGLRIRASLTTAVFRKVLVLRQDSLQSFSSGKLNNLITTDVDKARKVVRFIHILLFTAPMGAGISLFSLYRLMGVSVFIGLGWMAFVMTLNPIMMLIVSKFQETQQARTDERVRKVTEVISAIQVVKCYAWEDAAKSKVELARKQELKSMWRLYCCYTCFEGLWQSVVPVTTAVMFAAYSMLNPDRPLTAAQAFTAMTLLGMLQEPLFTIPWVFTVIIEALVSAKRLERLFVMKEVQLPSTRLMDSFCSPGLCQPPDDAGQMGDDPTWAVDFEAASFMWPRTSQQDSEGRGAQGGGGSSGAEGEGATSDSRASGSASPDAQGGDAPEEQEDATEGQDGAETASAQEFRLCDLSFRVPSGALVAVVGATASGKTSLLHAVLGEMPRAEDAADSGHAHVRRQKPIGFASQHAWVSNATVRQNILFGESYSEKKYQSCLRCCDLEKDLELLKAGDQTKVGERGIALSGGQKARVCLARAAYRQDKSSLFLLDDPYSALDAHVARKVHEEAVQKFLTQKTRLVATNRLEFVRSCDLVIVLAGGKVEAVGTFEAVCQESATLRKLLVAQGLDETQETTDAPVPPPASLPLTRVVSRQSSGGGHAEADGEGGEETGGAEGGDDEEARASGQVKKEVVVYYLKQMGGWCTVGSLVGAYIVAEALSLALPLYLAHWTDSAPEERELGPILGPYVVLSVLVVGMMVMRDLYGNILGFRAAGRLHKLMFDTILRAPMSFFQDTPHGRIINRFSKDMSEIDNDLIWQFLYTIVPVISVLGNFTMVGGTAYVSLLLYTPLLWLYYQVWKYYNKAALDMKRISKTLSSPVYDHFNNLCRENAISIVRAHHQVQKQCRLNSALVMEQQRPEYSMMYMENWFSMRIEHLGCVLVFLVALFCAAAPRRLVSSSVAALALTFSSECSNSIQSMIGQVAEFGLAFNCIERVMEYATALPAEAALASREPPRRGWPDAGVLEVSNLQLRYRPTLPLVLKGVSFSTNAGERIGICGRTGAGKSSLLLALLRVVEPEPGSSMRLDGEDLTTLGLRDVRAGIAMIPQDPVLFQETLLYNCDPFGEHAAEKVWRAIEEAQLGPWVLERAAAPAAGSSPGEQPAQGQAASAQSSPGPAAARPRLRTGSAEAAPSPEKLLQLEIKEGGQNLSAGQRQMVAIARAVLRESKLVVLDEATAALDAATDAAIQLAIRRCFKGATTLTIAHRLQTISDSDRVLVLADGEVAELGSPAELREVEGGIFRGMLEEAENQ